MSNDPPRDLPAPYRARRAGIVRQSSDPSPVHFVLNQTINGAEPKAETQDLKTIMSAVQAIASRLDAIEHREPVAASALEEPPRDLLGGEETPAPDVPDLSSPGRIYGADVGDWRKAAARVDQPDDDFSIGMEIKDAQEPEPPPAAEEPKAERSGERSMERGQILYELAIQAVNGSARAKALLVGPAERRGVDVDELAEQILREREQTVQRVLNEF